MDKTVIRKVIDHCGEPCPDFKYGKPLLDKNVADLLSKGFVKLLNKQDSSNVNHRTLVLENIRKSCKVEPSNHLSIDDNVTDMLRRAYESLPENSNIYKLLDSFLIRNLKEADIRPHHSPCFKPDIVQALVNLSRQEEKSFDVILKDIIHWNIDSEDNGYSCILKSMWNEDCIAGLSRTQSDDISIKIKPFIEKTLLSIALEMLNIIIIDEDDWLSKNEELKNLITLSSVSCECFQICCCILNSIFINTKFDLQMHNFITYFIKNISYKVENISQLYPSNLKDIVLLLDIELDSLKGEIKETYVAYTLEHLDSLHKECESDLIMMLTHFDQQWFQLYFNKQMT